MAPGLSFSFLSVVIVTESGSPVFKAPSAMAWSEPHDMISARRGRQLLQPWPALRHLEPSSTEIRHSAPFPCSSRKMRFDMSGFGVALRYQCDFRAHG